MHRSTHYSLLRQTRTWPTVVKEKCVPTQKPPRSNENASLWTPLYIQIITGKNYLLVGRVFNFMTSRKISLTDFVGQLHNYVCRFRQPIQACAVTELIAAFYVLWHHWWSRQSWWSTKISGRQLPCFWMEKTNIFFSELNHRQLNKLLISTCRLIKTIRFNVFIPLDLMNMTECVYFVKQRFDDIFHMI